MISSDEVFWASLLRSILLVLQSFLQSYFSYITSYRCQVLSKTLSIYITIVEKEKQYLKITRYFVTSVNKLSYELFPLILSYCWEKLLKDSINIFVDITSYSKLSKQRVIWVANTGTIHSIISDEIIFCETYLSRFSLDHEIYSVFIITPFLYQVQMTWYLYSFCVSSYI